MSLTPQFSTIMAIKLAGHPYQNKLAGNDLF